MKCEILLENGTYMGGDFYEEYSLLTTVNADITSLKVKTTEPGNSFKVVAKSKNWKSLPSKAVTDAKPKVINLPGRINGSELASTDGASLFRWPKTEDRPETFYIWNHNKSWQQPKVTVNFKVNIEKSGWYTVTYRGKTEREGEFFKLWSGNQLLGTVDYYKDEDMKKSDKNQVYLTAGKQDLEMSVAREGFDRWGLVWVDFTLKTPS